MQKIPNVYSKKKENKEKKEKKKDTKKKRLLGSGRVGSHKIPNNNV